ncbi:MAG: (d)CMP kinase [Desulfuromonas sp.]|nr:(d)CMP kinase [Desulfuromonas sp.]
MLNDNSITTDGLIVAIDGPSGAGKSTLSKLLAQRLGYTNINTGAMFRAVALAIKRSGISLDDHLAIEQLCNQLHIHFKNDAGVETVWLGDEDVSRLIRGSKISMLTSEISALPVVRKSMLELQRKMAAHGGVVLEGRDIGSVVFPDAQVKFFLCASAQARGLRRHEELIGRGELSDLEQTIAEVQQRDAADSSRKLAPLIQAADAIPIDSTSMSIEQVLEQMLQVIAQRRQK